MTRRRRVYTGPGASERKALRVKSRRITPLQRQVKELRLAVAENRMADVAAIYDAMPATFRFCSALTLFLKRLNSGSRRSAEQPTQAP